MLKYVESTVNCSTVGSESDMTIVVDWEVKPQTKQNKMNM